MPLDHYVSLGRSGLRISPMTLGTLTFGHSGGYGGSSDETLAVLDRYLDAGGNSIDTANYYSHGEAEQVIGDALAARPGLRDRLVIATKFGTGTVAGDPNSGGAGRKAILAACEGSLRRLRTDYIDLYWQHFEDPFTPVEETMSALDDLVRAGKVRYVGLSDAPAWRVVQAQLTATARNWAPLIALQLEYSLAERRIEAEHVPMAAELGLGIMPFALLAEGLLTGKYARSTANGDSLRATMAVRRLKERTVVIIGTLARVAARHGTTSARVALAWVLRRPGITSGIIGARTVPQLEENLAALDLELAENDLDELGAVSPPPRNFAAGTTENMLPVAYPGLTIDGRHFPPNRWSLQPGQSFR
ncbi:MAG TPA: aldo/keto reductase [Amycolatopsis sp.]|nr:aldo/keto reductase [Amycolatopsis sp.]